VVEQVKLNKDQIEKIKKEQIGYSKDQNQKLNEIYKRLDQLEKYLFTYTEGIQSGIIRERSVLRSSHAVVILILHFTHS